MITVPIVLIGGTTASGKSALALELAARTGARIVNADAQQLYADLPVLTARPQSTDLARAEHRLYGILGPEVATSAGLWLEMVRGELLEAERCGRPVLLVGGTAMYMKALLEGLAPVPPIPEPVRARWRSSSLPAPALHALLAERDPRMAARLHPSDRQRVLRALEVLEATGRSLRAFQAQTRPALALRGPVRGVALLPPRPELHARIARRFAQMVEAGVVEEVQALARRLPDLADLPIARVHGCRELLRAITGEWSLAVASRRTIEVTRQYAKRQRTFFRHQLAGFEPFEMFGGESRHLVDRLARALDSAA